MMEKKHKILVVDDDEFIRIYFKDVFWIHGLEKKYDIQTVPTIEEAEKIIDSPKTRPDTVFLDLAGLMFVDGREVTTVEAGFSLLKRIKDDPKTKDIKVIMYTGYSDKEYSDKAHQLGADGYLVKGENLPKELIKFIEDLK
ncbi:response regulator [Candidatus Parcubacteria bacterium]|nr:response regulator [Candidatus Parcubacteria bacterium]